MVNTKATLASRDTRSGHPDGRISKMHNLANPAENKDQSQQEASQQQPHFVHRRYHGQIFLYWMSKCSGCNSGSDFTITVWPATSSNSCNHLAPLPLSALATSGFTRSMTSRSRWRLILRIST